ncbi:MAG: tRNA lysidine(34) synthetase TilS [Cyclobacteriaceae bacterium]|nr:tRNA lysidine(34) synthetase TilS [Cyclobacteriaceae bacterium]
MEKQFSHFIKNTIKTPLQDQYLLAVSGGVDSMVMAHLFRDQGFSIGLAHVNFTLRGKDAELDQEFVKSLAESWGVPYYHKRVDTADYARSKRISLQMAAREIRYQWFEELLASSDYQWVVTAHHQNDELETMLLNFTKGTGLAGLHGIAPKRGNIIRPLLFATKQRILDYARKSQISWREDSSNQSDYYQRNLIRNKVIPILKEINPKLEQTAHASAEVIGVAETVFLRKVEEIKATLLIQKGDHIWIDTSLLTSQPLPIWFQILNEYGFNYQQVIKIADTLGKSGSKFISSTFQLNVDRHHLVITPLNKQSLSGFTIDNTSGSYQQGNKTWTLARHEAKSFSIKVDDGTGAFDLESLQFPLRVRNWEPGDWFHPLGMSHRKKVSDLLVDVKVPLNLKDEVQVVTSGEDIVWVVGFRIDDRFKITQQTEKVLEITINNALQE